MKSKQVPCPIHFYYYFQGKLVILLCKKKYKETDLALFNLIMTTK
jgi:hypothetical protein